MDNYPILNAKILSVRLQVHSIDLNIEITPGLSHETMIANYIRQVDQAQEHLNQQKYYSLNIKILRCMAELLFSCKSKDYLQDARNIYCTKAISLCKEVPILESILLLARGQREGEQNPATLPEDQPADPQGPAEPHHLLDCQPPRPLDLQRKNPEVEVEGLETKLLLNFLLRKEHST